MIDISNEVIQTGLLLHNAKFVYNFNDALWPDRVCISGKFKFRVLSDIFETDTEIVITKGNCHPELWTNITKSAIQEALEGQIVDDLTIQYDKNWKIVEIDMKKRHFVGNYYNCIEMSKAGESYA